MKTNLLQLVLICLILMDVISPVSLYADPTTTIDTYPTSNISNNKYEIINSDQTTLTTQSTHAGKEILLDDSRGLSAFFIFGIAINIIMAVTFGWWFSREWKKSKNNKG